MRFRIAAVGLLFLGCYSSGEGKSPPLERIYFPVGLAIDKDNTRLYVANSDFDLQFNAGSLQSLDLERVRELVPTECESDDDCPSTKPRCDSEGDAPSHFCVAERGEPCGALGEQTVAERVLVPGRCSCVDLENPADGGSSVLVDSVEIGAFATDVQLHYGGPEGESGRMYIPVRGEASLHWIDVADNGDIDCGQSGDSRRCDEAHRVGTDEDENTRGLRMPREPYGIALSESGDALVVTHQTDGAVSLFHQDPNHWEQGPTLEFVQTDLPLRALSVANAPLPLVAREARADWLADAAASDDPFPPGFLVTYRNAAQVDLLRYYADGASSPLRPYLQAAASVSITANSIGTDSRGIVFDDSERKACEDACSSAASSERTACLEECAAMPIGVYVASRAPASLLVGQTVQDTWATPNRDVPAFYDTVPLPAGPSRLYVGKVVGDDGVLETRIFVICFDQRRIAIYDPKRRTLEGFVTTGRGPHAMAFDFAEASEADGTPARALAYVAHFTDSYVGVIELDRRKFRTYSNIVLNLGQAVAPRASK